jgi:hypothetical protein
MGDEIDMGGLIEQIRSDKACFGSRALFKFRGFLS